MSPLLVLIVAVLATSYAGPIVRFAAAPALAIAFWRLTLVLPVTGGLAGRASDARRGLGYRTRRDRGEPHRSGRRAPLVRSPGGRRPRAARRTHWRGLLRHWAARSSNRRDLALRDRRVCSGRRGARPARAGPQHAAGGVRGTRLDGVRCDGCGTDADRPHWNELRAAPL